MNIDFNKQCNIEDETSDINDLHPSVNKAITEIIKKECFIHYKVYNKIIQTEGGNYNGILYDVIIKGKTVNGKNEEVNIFVKQMTPKNAFVSSTEVFSKELFIYTELAKICTELQNNADIPLENRFKLVNTYDGININAIILENITKHGFKTSKKMDVMTLNYAELAVEHLAKFHGLGFIIERMRPEFFERKIKSLKQSVSVDSRFPNKFYEVVTRKLPNDLITKTDKWWKTGLENYFECLQGTMTNVKCLCHGDFKMNNVMYKEIEGEITEVIAIDYQLIYYGSPVIDFLYFIYTGTDQTFRRKHLNHLKDHYHVSLKKYLEYFNVFIDDVYPRKIFEKDLEDCADYGLVSAIWILPFLLALEPLDIIDIENIHLGLKLDDNYYERLKGILDDFF